LFTAVRLDVAVSQDARRSLCQLSQRFNPHRLARQQWSSAMKDGHPATFVAASVTTPRPPVLREELR